MSRCPGCDACQSQWDTGNCKYCNYPEGVITTEQQKIQQLSNPLIKDGYKLAWINKETLAIEEVEADKIEQMHQQ